ncbi:hypothetical protein GOA66_13960 [Sinorhizobium meliloti]|uniref:hypothetical protein n=1 Tax=Rhizobium meliloti TaxID=382 RepID=UPI00299EA093|nr:hypothetical protein [Sinorhizobium meliloti]MDW9523794.1 hypothetical protein [Sinorhizobium meliloti]MDW9877462.1 hypothetical protein [Sinorhizobium meliloti]
MAEEEKKSVKPFPLEVNGARGEASLKIDDVELVIAATMSGLAAVSTRLECRSFQELFMRLSGVEAAAVLAGIELLTIKGDRLAAIQKLKLRHFKDCAAAFNAALAHHFDGDEGNAEAVDETAN